MAFHRAGGGAGNWLNAWGHRDAEHLSIGASTAVFAALGMLVAAQCTMRTLALRQVRVREFLLPVGAGLGLLAYLGVGDQQTDYMAHFFGLLAGVPFGVAGVWLRLGTRTPRLVQAVLAWSAAAIVASVWWLAARHGARFQLTKRRFPTAARSARWDMVSLLSITELRRRPRRGGRRPGYMGRFIRLFKKRRSSGSRIGS